MTNTPQSPKWLRLAPFGAALLAIIVAVVALALAAEPTDEPDVIIPTFPPSPTPTPVPNYAMWSLGTGGGELPYSEWVAVYPQSSLWPFQGAPSMRFTNHAPETPEDIGRTFEIGWYKYGPTWYSENFIVEFWLGDGGGGSLSVAGNDNGGGQLEVRNPTDTDHISLNYWRADHPQISVGKQPLYMQAAGGLYSESEHTFSQGINIPPESGHSGQVIDGAWQDGVITVSSAAITAESLVLITPISPPVGQWWVTDLVPGKSFTVHSIAGDEDMNFNWLIVN